MRIFIFFFSVLSLAGCSASNLDKNDSAPAQAKQYTLTRQFQRVVRYNCQGQTTSDQTETVGSPNTLVQIVPTTNYHLDHAQYLNLTTNSSPGCIISQDEFAIDTSPTVCNMQVNPGLNHIQYSFYYCDLYQTQADGSQVCSTALRLGEKGEIYVNVNYQEVHLSGMTEIHPDPTTCTTTTKK